MAMFVHFTFFQSYLIMWSCSHFRYCNFPKYLHTIAYSLYMYILTFEQIDSVICLKRTDRKADTAVGSESTVSVVS